jgi:hypothetical protein
MKAGADYLSAIRNLGLDPVYLGWGWEMASERWLLVLVTSIIDAGGPLALHSLLIQAYNAEATPKEISPFIVRVFSPDFLTAEALSPLNDRNLAMKTEKGETIPLSNVEFDVLGIHLERINSYMATGQPISKYGAKREAWQRFKRQVDRLAA